MGLGKCNSLGEYCDPRTASSVFLILLPHAHSSLNECIISVISVLIIVTHMASILPLVLCEGSTPCLTLDPVIWGLQWGPDVSIKGCSQTTCHAILYNGIPIQHFHLFTKYISLCCLNIYVIHMISAPINIVIKL